MKQTDLIELLGPSGVGKSTVLAAVEGRSGARRWVFPSSPTGTADAKATRAQIMEALDAPEIGQFIDQALACIARIGMPPSRRLNAMNFLAKSCHERSKWLASGGVVVHEELLLHRAFSFLHRSPAPREDAQAYFHLAPAPTAAAVFVADQDTILGRVRGRTKIPNCYADLADGGLVAAIENGIAIAGIAHEALSARGVPVIRIDAREDVDANAEKLAAFISSIEEGHPDA